MRQFAAKIPRYTCPVIAAFTPAGLPVLVSCGLWTCPVCSRRLARKWARRVRLHIEANDQTGWFFITLTFGSDYRSPTKAFAALPQLWGALQKEMKRRYPGWQYMAFVEGQAKTRGGMPHFHIISNRHPPSEKGKKGQWTKHGLHNWAVKRGFGFEVECDPVIGTEAAGYVSKYASKGDPSMPRKFRRVRASRTWTKIPKDPNKRLMVPAKGESLIDFLMRVNERSEVPLDDLYQRWHEANEALKRANDTGED